MSGFMVVKWIEKTAIEKMQLQRERYDTLYVNICGPYLARCTVSSKRVHGSFETKWKKTNAMRLILIVILMAVDASIAVNVADVT